MLAGVLALAIAVSHQHHPALSHHSVFLTLHWVDDDGGALVPATSCHILSAPGGSARPSWRIYMGVVASALITELIGIHLILGHSYWEL